MRKTLLLLLLLPCLIGKLNEEDVSGDLSLGTGVEQLEEALQEDERELSGELKLDGSYDARGALGRVWERLASEIRKNLKSELRFGVSLVSIALLCSLAAAMSPAGNIQQIVELSACCGAALITAGDLGSVVNQAASALDRMYEYAMAALPAFFTTVAVSGAVSSASVKYASICFAADVFMSASQGLILPMIRAFLAVAIAGSIFPNAMLEAAARFSKWCAITAMTLITSGFCLFVSLSGVISGTADQMAVKTTKTVISAALPVVGRILSDSASSILAAASMIRNTAGVFSLIVICAICAAPFALLSVKLLVYKACSALSELSCGGRYAKLLSNIGTAFAMLLGLVGSYGVMLFFSFMSGLRMAAA